MTTQVAGYTYGTNDVARSPLTLEDLNLLKQTVFTEDDEKYLEKLEKCWQTKLMRFWWYSFVGSHPHLAQYFSTSRQSID